MGSKGSQSTATTTIPPEILQRYQDVNTQAQGAAATPFQSYSSDPSAFVAPLTPTQQAGVQGTNAYASSAQPYFDAATGQLVYSQGQTAPYYGAATDQLGQAQATGTGLAGASYGALQGAQGAAAQPNTTAGQAYTQAYGQAQPFNIGALLQYLGGQQAAAPLQTSAAQNITGAQGVGNLLAGSSLDSLAGANASSNPLLGSAAGNITGANAAANPYNQQAAGNINTGLGTGSQINSMALQQYLSAIGNAGGLGSIGSAAGSIASGGASGAMGSVNSGIAAAQPYLSSAGNYYGNAIGAATPLQTQAAQGLGAAQAGAAGDLNNSGQYIGQGAQAVNPSALDDAAINRYMSPYLQTVLQGTSGLLNQQNQQAMAGQLGNAISSGAYGGDRSGIAAANLAQQQRLADASIFSGILNQGYDQALGTAQQQQQLGLGAAQANRAAQQNAAGQSLALGQERFGQAFGTAQAQGALGQQLYGQQLGVGQAQQGLGNQYFQQGLGAAGIGIQGAGLGIQAQQIQAQLAQAQLQAQLQGAQGIAGVGQQQFGQNLSAAQAQAGLGQQVYGQQLGTGTAQAGLAGQLFGQGATTAEQQAAISNMLYGQGLGAGQAQAGLGNQLFGQGQALGQGTAGIGQQIFGQGTGYGTAQQGLGAQLYGQGANTASQLGQLGGQQFGQGLSASQQLAQLAQGIYGTGAATSQGLANLGQGAQGAGLAGAQAQLAAGQTEQQTSQAGLTALYNQFLQQQSYPFQVAQFLANIAEGTGALSGNTTTTNQVANGIFSDRRLKENIQHIGKTFDGQPIYSFRYKGEPHTEMGLIAQEVEKKHPEAVGLAAGFKTVDYGKATGDSAKRGHFAYGGAPGFDPGVMQQILANYQQMYGPLAASKGGLGAGTIVPQANLPVTQLHAAEAPRMALQNPADTAKGFADAGNSIGKLGDMLGAWDFGGEKDKETLPSGDDYDPYAQFGSASGGRIGFAAGGMPYQGLDSLALDIPDEEQKVEQLKAAQAGQMPKNDFLGDANKVAGTALSIAKLIPMISDKRAKENIKPVGKTFDGQTVYSYNLKGDSRKRMGLIAQEVEKKHPRAVGSHKGLKTVDYAEATADSAKRGHFAEGGETEVVEEENPILEALRRRLHPELNEDEPSADGLDDAFAEEEVVEPDGDVPEEAVEEEVVPASAPAPRAAPIEVAAEEKLTPSAAAPVAGGIAGIANLIAKAEGTGKNPKSSAEGYGQFLDKTFVNTFRKTFPGEAGLSDQAILGRRGSGVEKPMLHKFTADNAATLTKAGFEPTPGNIYLAHFLGSGGAKSVLGADPETPVSAILEPAAIRANASVLRGKTAADVADWAAGRIASMAQPRRLASGGVAEDVETALSDEEQAKQDAAARALIVASRAADNTRPLRQIDLNTALGPPQASPLESAAAQSGPPMPSAMGLGAAGPAIPPQMASGPPENLLPPPAAALPPAGLAAAAPPPPEPPLGQMPTPDLLAQPKPRGFFKGLGHGDASSIIPLLSGIGALASTQTNNPLTAIAAGLGAGAQSAQGQREFARKQQETSAQALAAQTGYQGLSIRAKQASNEYMNALSGRAREKQAWLAQYQPLATALSVMGKRDPLLESQIAEMTKSIATDTGAMSVGAVAPTMSGADTKTPAGLVQTGMAAQLAGLPGGAGLTQVGLNAKDTGKTFDEAGNVTNTPGAVPAAVASQVASSMVGQNMEARADAGKEAMAAYDLKNQATKFRSQMVDDKGNPTIYGGPLEKFRTGIGSLLLSAGMSPEAVSVITTTDPTKAGSLSKMNTTLAAMAARNQLGPGVANRQGEFFQFLNNTPGPQMPTATALWIIDNAMVPQAQNTIDRANYVYGLDPTKDDISASVPKWQAEHPWGGSEPAKKGKEKPTAPVKIKAAAPKAAPQKDGVYYPTSIDQLSAIPNGGKYVIPAGVNKGKINTKVGK